jgi:8-oxo-dGTP pyrophosphatase MutT (NUDIX family)
MTIDAGSAESSADEPLIDVPAVRHVVSSTLRFHGRVWDVRTDIVDLGDGQQVERDVVQHPGAVGIVAVDDDMRVLLVRQYRHPVSAILWEPPAGLLDIPGEDPLDAAARELFEEAGYRASTWSVLLDVFMTPGGSSESVRLYLARGLTPVAEGERFAGEGEEREMISRWVPLVRVRAAVLAGELHSPLCTMGILAAATVLIDGTAGTGGTSGAEGPRPVDSPWFRAGAPSI